MEQKDILEFLDLTDVKDLDAFKEKFKGKFITKEEAMSDDDIKSKFTGKMSGSAVTLAKRLYGLTNEEVKDKKWEEVIELGTKKLSDKITELEGKQGQSNDEAIKDAQAKLEKALKTISESKEAHQTLQSTYEKEKGDWEGKYKGLKIGNISEAAKSKILPKLKSDLSPAESLGFEAAIKDFAVDFNEKDEPIVNGKDGKRIPNPAKAGSYLSLEEAYELKAVELNLIKKNNAEGGQRVNQNMFQNQQQQIIDPKIPVRTIHPGALAHAESLKVK